MGMSLLTGIALSYGWGAMKRTGLVPKPSETHAESAPLKPAARTLPFLPPPRPPESAEQFSIGSIEKALGRYDGLTDSDLLEEARLRCLMFAVPKDRLDDVLQMLRGMKNPGKFQEAACALFSRWTELDPLAALDAAESAGVYSSQARRGIVTTWLNMDPDAALESILARPTPEDVGFIKELLDYKGMLKPEDAARLVDKIVEKWPEADSKLFTSVAKQWAKTEPERAAKWAASNQDTAVTQPLLKQMAVDVSRTTGRPALAVSNMITDPKLKQQARNQVMGHWGQLYGGYSLSPTASPGRNISKGFPADWTDEDIGTFSRGFVDNFADQLPELLDLAEDEEERILICENAIAGSQNIDPRKITVAVEMLPDSYVQSERGKATLGGVMIQFAAEDPKAAAAWLQALSPGPKRDFMQAQLPQNGGKP